MLKSQIVWISFALLLMLASSAAAEQPEVATRPEYVGVHPDERTAYEELTRVGGTCAVTQQGRLLQLYLKQSMPEDFFKHFEPCKSLRGISTEGDAAQANVLNSLPELPTVQALYLTIVPGMKMNWVARVPNVEGVSLYSKVVYPETTPPWTSWPVKEPVSAAEMEPVIAGIAKFSKLKVLRLYGQQINQASISQLTKLEHLNILDLNDTPVDDACLSRISSIQSLQELHLENTKVTDVGIAALSELPSLQYLTLNGTAVTDRSLALIARTSLSKSLKYLCLKKTAISDEGLKSIAGLVKIQVLDLDHTQITGAGLRHLQKMEQLYCLTLNRTSVKEADVRELLKHIPRLRSVGYDRN